MSAEQSVNLLMNDTPGKQKQRAFVKLLLETRRIRVKEKCFLGEVIFCQHLKAGNASLVSKFWKREWLAIG